MAVNRYKCKLLLNAKGIGVSETYNIVSDTIQNASTSFTALIQARQALLCTDVTLFAGITSDTDIRGDSLISEGFPLVGTYNPEAHPTTYNPYVTNLYRTSDATLVHRGLRHLRLIPSDQFESDGSFSPVVGWSTPRTTFFNMLVAAWSIAEKIKGAVAAPFYTYFPIAQAVSERESNKRVGRPFGLSVGRRTIR